MSVEQILELLVKLDDTRWTMYHRGLAEDIAERKITDEEWGEILDEFDNETEDLWGGLYEAFSEAVRSQTEGNDNE